MSKYPITNFIKDFVQEDSWKYGYFKIEKDGIPYYFYLIHTSSPVSDFDYQKRNQQLITIKKDYYQQHEDYREKDAKIVRMIKLVIIVKKDYSLIRLIRHVMINVNHIKLQ